MTTPDDIPNANELTLNMSKDAKWFIFDFGISEGRHAGITMHLRDIHRAVQNVINTLSDPLLRGAIPARGLQKERVYRAPVVPAVEFGSSTTGFGEQVAAEFELPGGVQLLIGLSPRDAKLLASALIAAADKAESRQNLTRQ